MVRPTSITAGTLFEATKLPLTVWFQAIYLLTQDRFNRRFDLPDIIPRLVYVALRTPPMPERLLELRLGKL